MKKLNDIITEMTLLEEKSSSVNNHLRHLEDLPLYHSADYISAYLKNLPKASVSIKMDGSPAIFCGEDTDGSFFVAKKGIFNKSPQLFKSIQDASSLKSNDLKKKISYSFKYLRFLNPKRILQGDYLYTRSDLKKQNIQGKEYITFQGNTLIYGAPVGSELAKRIVKTSIGVAFHTVYKGHPGNLKISHGSPKGMFNNHTRVWTPSVYIDKPDDTYDIDYSINECRSLVRGSHEAIDWASKSILGKQIEKYHNHLIREGRPMTDVKRYNDGLKQFFEEKYPNSVQYLRDDYLEQLFKVRAKLQELKDTMISTYQDASNNVLGLSVFVNKHGKLSQSKHEGFVVSVKGAQPVKLVDRETFSRLNFNGNNSEKGFDRDEKTKETNK